ncbi:hypothetical protein IWZ01DRAFT_485785 [Phyllosticta capitalensis]
MAHSSRHRPPAKTRKLLPSNIEDHAVARNNISDAKEGPLTSLPLELFRIVIGYTIDTSDFDSMQVMLPKRTVNISELFDREVTNAITKGYEDAGTARFWNRNGPAFLRAALSKEKVFSGVHDQIVIVSLIHHAVDRILDAQGDRSEETRRHWIQAACTCVAHSKRVDIRASLGVMLDGSEARQRLLMEDIRPTCWAIVAWEGNALLLKAMGNNYEVIGVPPIDKADSPRFMGSAQWAATYRENHGAIMALRRQFFDFGVSGRDNPLETAMETGSWSTFHLILSYLSQDDADDIVPVGRRLVQEGKMSMAELFFDPHRHYSTITGATTALESLCRNGRSNYVKFAQLLLQAGAKVNQAFGSNEVDTALTLAIKYGPSSLVRTLIKNGARPRAAKYEPSPGSGQIVDPLSIAIKTRNLPAVEILLECNSWERLTRNNALIAAINAGDPDGSLHSRPPGDVRILELLLEGFDPESSKQAAQMGRGAVKRARSEGKVEMLEMLINHGC